MPLYTYIRVVTFLELGLIFWRKFCYFNGSESKNRGSYSLISQGL